MGEDLCYRDPTLGLQDLYNKLQAGPGTRVIEPAAIQLGKLAKTVAGLPELLNDAVRRAGGEWHGHTATTVTAALQQAGDVAAKGGEATHAGTGRVSDYASSYATLKSQVSAPVPVPDLSFFGRIADNFGAMSDHSKAVKQNTENAVAAARALAEHERRTNAAIVAFPDIASPPPPLTKPGGPNHVGPPVRPGPPPGAPAGRWGYPGTNGVQPRGGYTGPEVSSPTDTAGQHQSPVLPGPPSAGPGTTNAPTLTPAPGTPGPGILMPPMGRGPGLGGPPGTRGPAGDRPATPGRATNTWPLSPESPMRPRGFGTPGIPPGGPGFAPGGPARPPSPPMGIPPFLVAQPEKKDERETHHNDTFLPSDELFRPPPDDAVSPVIPREEFNQ